MKMTNFIVETVHMLTGKVNNMPTAQVRTPKQKCPVTRQHQVGHLSCEGSGFAVLEMSGSVHVESMDGGNAYILGAKSVRASGEGEWIDQGAWTFLLGWHGQLSVNGSRYQIQLAKRAISFEASGEGAVRIRGDGYCVYNNKVIHLTPEFQEIQLH